MQIIIGRYMGLTTRRVEPDRSKGHTWDAFDERTITLLIERGGDKPPYTLEVQIGSKEFDLTTLPEQNEYAAFEYSVTARSVKDRAYMTYKAWRALPAGVAAELLSVARG